MTLKEVKQEVWVSKEARLLLGRLKNFCASAGRTGTLGRGAVSCVCSFILATLLFLGAATNALAATYRTSNFIVNADSADFARKVGEAAEQYRRNLAILWLGEELPRWSSPCVVTVTTGPTLGAGGETVFTFCNDEVFDWKMTAQGTEERVLDSVLPHEITHTILASYLRAPAPRWIDEGMATSVEADVERTNYRLMLADFLHSRKGIAFNDMVAMKEYPTELMPFYSQSFSVCEYLILIGGRRRLAEFAREGARSNDWNAALRRYYEGRSLGDLQLEWVAWVGAWDAANRPAQLPATPKLRDFDEWRREEMLASRGSIPGQAKIGEPTARAQSVEPVAEPSKWKTTLGDAFDGVRSWGRGGQNGQKREDLTALGSKERVETTSAAVWQDAEAAPANVRGDRSRQFGETRQVAPDGRNERVARNAQNATVGANANVGTNANVGERRATIWIPRANALTSASATQATRSGVLASGAGSASRTNVF
ncbi:MAG: hypothetical protein IJE97_15815 [Thermoguttaceae bacterium]|nr:hypothetical protein [Thermoguttaceae bacterium]